MSVYKWFFIFFALIYCFFQLQWKLNLAQVVAENSQFSKSFTASFGCSSTCLVYLDSHQLKANNNYRNLGVIVALNSKLLAMLLAPSSTNHAGFFSHHTPFSGIFSDRNFSFCSFLLLLRTQTFSMWNWKSKWNVTSVSIIRNSHIWWSQISYGSNR